MSRAYPSFDHPLPSQTLGNKFATGRFRRGGYLRRLCAFFSGPHIRSRAYLNLPRLGPAQRPPGAAEPFFAFWEHLGFYRRMDGNNADFWAGTFGDDYTARNSDNISNRIAQFSTILRRTNGVASVTELGANVGLNLLAIRSLLPKCQLKAVEVNETAFGKLSSIDGIEAVRGSLLDTAARASDLAFTAGVLIHIEPSELPRAYRRLFDAATRYVLVIEYFNSTPVEIAYRGHSGRLFKRDWASEMLDMFPLRLLDYGFIYRRDPNWPRDDVTWFLMEKV